MGFVVKGSDLDEVLVSRVSVYGEPSNGFDGVFHIEAVSLEGGSDAGGPSTASEAITHRGTGTQKTDTNDYGRLCGRVRRPTVQFLQPATVPTLEVDLAAADSSTVEFTMEIGPETTDIVTVLATKVPEGAYFTIKSDHDDDPGTADVHVAVGAKAEVPGVWVLPASVFMGQSGPTRSTPTDW